MSRQSNIKMPENSKFEIVYALQGARTLKKYMKFKIQNSELSRAPPFPSALPLFQLSIDSIFGTSIVRLEEEYMIKNKIDI